MPKPRHTPPPYPPVDREVIDALHRDLQALSKTLARRGASPIAILFALAYSIADALDEACAHFPAEADGLRESTIAMLAATILESTMPEADIRAWLDAHGFDGDAFTVFD